jgi:predicted ATPase
MVRSLLSDRVIERDGDSYRVIGEIGRITVPASLHSLIGARLDSLPAADRTLLQEAAVLGLSFTAGALKAITTRPEGEVEDQLRSLVRRELLTLQLDPRSPERGQYAFVQSLTREVAYSTLSKHERRQRHLAAARYFEAEGDSELAGALAAHYLAAHEASAEGPEADAVAVQARHSLRAAADRAVAVGSHDHAITYLD